MSYDNLTVIQKTFSSNVQREAFNRLPETCDAVRKALTDAENAIMSDLDICESERATVDSAMCAAFLEIRNNVTNIFRDEQMRLLQEISKQGLQ
jgi:hypothetical protein